MENVQKEQILFITDITNFLVESIKGKLEHLGYRVVVSKLNIEEIRRCKGLLGAILIHVQENMAVKTKELTFLKDIVLENAYPIFLTGNMDDVNAVEKTLPPNIITGEVYRPVDAGELSEKVNVFIDEHRGKNKKKVLVVDDSGTTLRNVKNWLEQKYQVILANSATMALKYLTLNKPDLILLDYEMPVCDGKQLMEMLRADEDYSKVPIFFLTGRNDRESIAQVTVLRPAGYLLKTLPPAQIVKAIDDFFEKQKGEHVV